MPLSRPLRSGAAGLALALALLAAAGAAAQSAADLRRVVAAAVDRTAFGNFVTAAVGFSALPGVSAADFTIDLDGPGEVEATRLALPLSRRWEGVEILGGAPHTELTLAGFRASRAYPVFLPGTPRAARPDATATSLTAIGGLGLAFPVAEGTTLAPLVTLGYGRLEDDTTFSGPGARSLDRATRGVLFNVRVEQLIGGPALQLDHARGLGGDLRLASRLRADAVFSDTISVSDPALEASAASQVFTARADLDGPTGRRAFGRPLRWVLFGAGTAFTGDAADFIGADAFAELGGGLALSAADLAPELGLAGASLRASVVVGADVHGWSVGGRLEF